MPYLLPLPEEPAEEPALDPAPAEPDEDPLSPPDCFWVLDTAAAPVPDFSLQSFGRSARFGYLDMSHLSASLRATCFAFLPDLSLCEVVSYADLSFEVECDVVSDAVEEEGDVVVEDEGEVVVEDDCEPLKAAVLPIAVPVAAVPFEDEVVVPLFTEVSLEDGALADAAGAGELAAVPGMVEALDDVVVSALGDFLSLCMSPRANAEPLARATMVVITKAGASLRI
jgi:hypothetical protein